MKAEIMPDGFVPRRRGRKPTYDISDALKELAEHPGQWLKYTLPKAEAESALRQFSRMEIEAAVDRGEETSVLYVRSK